MCIIFPNDTDTLLDMEIPLFDSEMTLFALERYNNSVTLPQQKTVTPAIGKIRLM